MISYARPFFLASVSIASVAIFTACGGHGGSGGGRNDTFANFGDLASHEREGGHYSIAITDRNSPVSVFAIHGGSIDVGTHRIADAVAGADWNRYIFTGSSFRYHITSAHFDEPRALALAAKSDRCVFIHGHKNKSPRICVGGADIDVRMRVAKSLAGKVPFEILTDCPGLNGEDPRNPVNLCKKPGVQLEFSAGARSELFEDPALMSRTAQAIRNAVSDL